ncbi:MAG: hypothetical protein HYV63_01510 [Candidatus Schekmanbacteria bacterium]|nr:hypothetical protein [Candidatus Schekmanbacteria bacterium]
MLNNETVRLFAEAIIKSKSALYKSSSIIPRDVIRIFNGCNNALYDPRLAEEVTSGGERCQMLCQLQRNFSRMFYMQIRPQQNPAIATGQFFSVAEMLPGDCSREFPGHLQSDAAKLAATIASCFGVTIKEVLRTHKTVMEYLTYLGGLCLKNLPSRKPGTVMERANLLRSVLERLAPQLDDFRLVPGRLEQVFGRTMSAQLECYASVFSRTEREHRQVLAEKPYQVGREGLRLSSLDRFPLISGESAGIWYAPNMRLLGRAAPDVLHFAVNDCCRVLYELVRGASLELYLAKMLSSRAPQLKIIREEKWQTAKGEVSGPDLIVIDHREPPCVLALEVKFRKMLPSTRFELLDEDLTGNYGKLWGAVLSLPGKLKSVFNLSGGYAASAADLSRAENYRRWHIGLAGEAPFAFGELSRYLSVSNLDFPLHGFSEPWTAMSVETFERLVEVVVQHQRPLSEVMEEYCEDCQNLELSQPRAEMFRDAILDEHASYAATCLAMAH